MFLVVTVALLGLASSIESTPRTVDSVYDHEFCAEPLHRLSRFCGDRGLGADDPRREAYRWWVLQQRCRLADAPEYCKGIDTLEPGRPVMVLVYDHSSARWDLEGTRTDTRSSLDANGRPTVYAGTHDSLLVVITNTNPLIYGSSVGEVKEEEIAQLGALQALMTALGTALQSGLTIAGQRLTEAPPAPTRVLSGIDLSVAEAIAQVVAERQRRVLLLTDETLATKHAIDAIARCRDAMVAVLQQLELGHPTVYSCTTPQQRGPGSSRSITANLRQRYDDAVWLGADYKPAIARFFALLQMASPSRPGVAAAIADIERTLREAPSDGGPPVLLALVSEVRAALDRIAHAADVDAALGQEARRFANLDRALELDAGEKKLATAVDSVLAKAAEINLAAAVLDAAERRYADNLLGGVPRTWFEVSPPSNDVSWDVIRTYPISLAADAPYTSHVALAHPAKAATSYSLASTSSRLFGVDVGVTATNVVDYEFGAVADPQHPKQKVVGQTGETNRSGQFGIFLDYWIVQRWSERAAAWPVRPGLQVGAAVSTDHPAFHAGGALEVARYARFGGGVTFQRVTRLNGQHVGDPIESSDDIRTHDQFERGWYVSFAFALDSLSLFGGH